jgi:hypothetical protein
MPALVWFRRTRDQSQGALRAAAVVWTQTIQHPRNKPPAPRALPYPLTAGFSGLGAFTAACRSPADLKVEPEASPVSVTRSAFNDLYHSLNLFATQAHVDTKGIFFYFGLQPSQRRSPTSRTW